MSLNLRLHAKAVFPGRKLPMRPKKAGQIERVAEAQLFGDGLDAFIGLKQPPGDLLRQNLIHVSAQRVPNSLRKRLVSELSERESSRAISAMVSEERSCFCTVRKTACKKAEG